MNRDDLDYLSFEKVDDEWYRFTVRRAGSDVTINGEVYKAWDRSHGGWHWTARANGDTDPRRASAEPSRIKAVLAIVRRIDPKPYTGPDYSKIPL